MIPEDQLNDVDFTFSKYFHYRSTLGQGSFGHVVLAVSKATLETMAVKVRAAYCRLYRKPASGRLKSTKSKAKPKPSTPSTTPTS